MNEALLGANCLLSCGETDQTVIPPVGLPSESVQVNAAPPQSWTSMPRCCLYHARSAGASFALKKMPPMPVTRFIESPVEESADNPEDENVALHGGGGHA